MTTEFQKQLFVKEMFLEDKEQELDPKISGVIKDTISEELNIS